MSTEKKKYTRTQIELTCPCCNKTYSKDKSEYDRNQKLNRISYCSLKCSTKDNIKYIPIELRTFDIALWNKNNPDKVRKEDPFNYYLRLIKQRSKKRTNGRIINYELTIDQLKEKWNQQNEICPYTNLKLKLQKFSNKSLSTFDDWYLFASVDRIDSDKGYTIDNIEFISIAINFMKNKFSKESVVTFLNLISKNITT